MIDISKVNKTYKIRILNESDAELIVDLCKGNTLFYRYTEAKPTIDNVLEDMKALPPGMTLKDKYYIGFFDENDLVAIMDIIDGWPSKDIAYIGFFMMNVNYQGKNIGSSIIYEIESYMKSIGKTSTRLAVDDGNPQSSHFWMKCGYTPIKETSINGWVKHVFVKEL